MRLFKHVHLESLYAQHQNSNYWLLDSHLSIISIRIQAVGHIKEIRQRFMVWFVPNKRLQCRTHALLSTRPIVMPNFLEGPAWLPLTKLTSPWFWSSIDRRRSITGTPCWRASARSHPSIALSLYSRSYGIGQKIQKIETLVVQQIKGWSWYAIHYVVFAVRSSDYALGCVRYIAYKAFPAWTS